MAQDVTNGKPARRRHVRPEQIAFSIERVEYLTIEVKNAQAVTSLLDGIERRLAIVEDGLPASDGRPAALTRFEEAVRRNGAAHSNG